ncbi:MAG TPA: hypothetical protein VHL34_18875 [Rhizomicrobium sp.]|jgi:hypothetical protein|nr:hypothetical protein [Rhizomicrobium sp.]
MPSSLGLLPTLGILIAATVVEVSGDATLRIALYNHSGVTAARIGLFVLGAGLLFAYGTFLNLTPLEFREVVGLYIATLFVVWAGDQLPVLSHDADATDPCGRHTDRCGRRDRVVLESLKRRRRTTRIARNFYNHSRVWLSLRC